MKFDGLFLPVAGLLLGAMLGFYSAKYHIFAEFQKDNENITSSSEEYLPDGSIKRTEIYLP